MSFDECLLGSFVNGYPIVSATIEIYRLSKPGDIQVDMICVFGNLASKYYIDKEYRREYLILQFYRFGEWKMLPFSGFLEGVPRRYPPNFWVLWIPCPASNVFPPVDWLIELLPDERSTEPDCYIYNLIATDVLRSLFQGCSMAFSFDYFPMEPDTYAKVKSMHTKDHIDNILRTDTVANMMAMLTFQHLIKKRAARRWAYTGVDDAVTSSESDMSE
ncbi:hypothetical protein BC832DRAFT_596267 [Gaertneriomyces semiglobifer]|nr:hypothetical protein BC832DRAFT_596267 [Gaertneriomyces semiglobifer]